ncbi:hypothetical protein AVEN_226673-1 [Araneus ventricosus]|uniref:Uncharacterized protein n=1 Tax=Araneus ventricosus TaxID=182803 RepID=A0A4Y2CYG5_ARAVE|nr:hypothetical protein AVEN_226673-1 [Araneus ventricosus]
MPQAFANKLPEQFLSTLFGQSRQIPVITDCNQLLDQDGACLKNNPQASEEDFRFKEMKTFIKNLIAVNDTADRGAKLIVQSALHRLQYRYEPLFELHLAHVLAFSWCSSSSNSYMSLKVLQCWRKGLTHLLFELFPQEKV